MIWNGNADSILAGAPEPFFSDLRARARELAGRPGAEFDFGFTERGGHRPYFLTRPVASWLARELRFPAWTEATIRALPEVRIADWARTHEIPADPALASEEREGGTLAVGRVVPGYRRDDLNVFAPSEWEKRKETLTFQAWAAAAAASAAATSR